MSQWCWSECDVADGGDLLGEREGHCAAVLPLVTSTTDTSNDNSQHISSSDAAHLLVVGGFCEGELSGYPIVAPMTTLPRLRWQRLPYHSDLECDGASLTTVTQPTQAAYLFGGLDTDMDRRNSLYALTLRKPDASSPPEKATDTVSLDGLELEVRLVPTTGALPAPRSRHGAAACEARLFIFGGETDAAEQTNDLYVLDTTTNVWREIQHGGAGAHCAPPPRLLCLSLVFVSADRFVLYGGAHFVAGEIESLRDVWEFSTHSETWCAVAADAFPRCNGHVGACFPGTSSAVFIGGKDAAQGCDELKVVDYDPSTAHCECRLFDVKPAVVSGDQPHWRYTPAVVAVAGGLLLLAGQCRHPQTPSAWFLQSNAPPV